MRQITAAGDTFSWDADTDEAEARTIWFPQPPGRTVATDDSGTVLGTAVSGPNHGGKASHVATASFMVDPAQASRGVGRDPLTSDP